MGFFGERKKDWAIRVLTMQSIARCLSGPDATNATGLLHGLAVEVAPIAPGRYKVTLTRGQPSETMAEVVVASDRVPDEASIFHLLSRLYTGLHLKQKGFGARVAKHPSPFMSDWLLFEATETERSGAWFPRMDPRSMGISLEDKALDYLGRQPAGADRA